MNVIDLRTVTRHVDSVYNGVQQPMFSYTSIAEFKEYVAKPLAKEGKKLTLLKTHVDIIKYAYELNEYVEEGNSDKDIEVVYQDTGVKLFMFTKKNIWIATGEKQIVLSLSSVSKAKITYMRDSQGNIVKTDNTFIRLYAFRYLGSYIIAYTSSGIFKISLMNKGTLTAGIREDFNQIFRPVLPERLTYETKLHKMLVRKKPTYTDSLVFNFLMNPFSPTYLQPDASVKKVFKNRIKAKDRIKYIETERFRKFFIKQLGALMPELAEEIRKHNTPEDLALFIKRMREKVLEEGTVDDQIKVLVTTARFGYGEEMIEATGNPSQLGKYDDVPLLANFNANSNNGSGKVGGFEYTPYDDSEDVKKSTEVMEDVESASDMDEAEVKEMMKETDTLEDYIQTDEKPKP